MKRNDGKNFELQTKLFFSKLFEDIGYIVNKERMQFSGTQNGFDVQFVISDEFVERNVFIECKDYSTDLKFGNIYTKAHELEDSHKFYENDIAFFISPRANFSNSRNPEKSEPIFNNGKFPFEIRLLDLSNRVRQLFSIDKEIYKEVYGEFPTEDIDAEKEISRFESILKSRGVLKKIIVDERNRHDYISDINSINNLIQRTVSNQKTAEEQHLHYYLKSKNKKTLLSLIPKLFEPNDFKGIVLLGNPGLGKSIELKQLALSLWKIKEEEKIIPFFRSVNTFLPSSKIEQYLPKEWKHIQRLVIILDGLDEISKPKYFISQLEKFILDHKNEATQLKFVLSCRTNIYETSINSIVGFQSYFIDDISFSDAYKFLENTYNLPNEILSKFSNSQIQVEYLLNPYYLNLFGNYYETNKSIPSNKAILMEEYAKNRLEDDRKKYKYKNKSYDTTVVESICKRVAITMEARQINKIEENHLNILLKSEKNLFVGSCFVEKIPNENFWKFEHRNLQEFFVAKSLSKLSFDDIINFIIIEDTIQKVHPSWMNSVSYLLNLMEQNDTYDLFLQWLQQNDASVLFYADSNRIPKEVQTSVFQSYFTKRCKEQNLWISDNNTSTLDLARFANCQENIEYLLKEVKNKKNHRRARISAIDLIVKMDFTYKKEELKTIFLDLLAAPLKEVDFDFKVDVLRAIKDTKLYKGEDYIQQIIEALGKYDNHRLISGVLRLIEENNPENYLEYIQDITPKILDNSKKNYPKEDNWMSDEKEHLKSTLKKLDSINSIFFRIETILFNKYELSVENEDLEASIKDLIKAYSKNESFIYDGVISLIKNSTNYRTSFHDFEDKIFAFFEHTKTLDKAFNDILNSQIKFDDKNQILVILANKNNIRDILILYQNGQIKKGDIKYFRNNLSYVNFNLAKEFERLIMVETTYNFDSNLLSQTQRDKWDNFHKNETQVNFDLLFQKEKLLDKIQDYFSSQKETFVTYESNRENKKEYWNDLELRKRFPKSLMTIIYNALHENNGKASKEDVIAVLSEELYLIKKIKESLNDTKQIEVKDYQLKLIEKWCLKNLPKANFQDISKTNFNRTICELLWFFRNKFDFKYPENYLLDMLWIDGKMKTNDSNYYGHDYVFDNVNVKKLQERIAYNLSTKLVKDATFKSHANYVLQHDLKDSYSNIREYLLDDTQIRYFRSQILPEYINKNKDISLLKQLVKPKLYDQHSDDLTWEAVAILIGFEENSFVIEKLLEFLKIDDNHKNQLRTITYLIRANYEKAFQIFNQWLIKGIDYYKEEVVNYRISSSDWKQHNNKDSVIHLIELIKIGANEKYRFGRRTNPMQIASDVLLVIAEKNGTNTCMEIIEKVTVCIEELKGVEYETFYVNALLNDLNNVYYKLKSNPLSFREIEDKLEKYKYNF